MRLKRSLEDQELPTGVKLELLVEVEGQPKTVKWFKNSQEIHELKSIKIEKGVDEEYKLIVESAEITDAGIYRVILSTATEFVESSCCITINQAIKMPSFKKGLIDQSIPKV